MTIRRSEYRILALPAVLCLLAFCVTPAGVQTDTKESGFAIRGIKGLWWEGIEKYRLALPWLAKHRLNFLMLCYTSFPASSMDWRADYTPQEQAQIRELAAQAKRLGVHLCLSFNPGIWSKPPLVYSAESDYQRAWRKVKTVHSLGIEWFGLCLDDISRALEPADRERFGTLQAAQVYFVNRLWNDMKTLSPRPTLIFCPSAYTTEDARQHQDYIKTIGAGIDPEVKMFWTGPVVCSPRITAEDARTFGAWIRRKPFVWDNYPVNDMYPWRPLLSPVKNRSADLAGAVSGYLANPMKQWRISCLPLGTLAAYLNAPARYDPHQAMERTINEYPPEQRPALHLLVRLYGSAFWGEPGFPPQPRPTGREEAAARLPEYRNLRDVLAGNPALKPLWEDVKPTLEEDIALLARKSRDRLRDSPLQACGDEFEGGAGAVYGFWKFNHPVNYVYARPTGRDEMRVEFMLEKVPARGAALKLTACNDDIGGKVKVRIALNDTALLEGASPFKKAEFSARTFDVPASALRPGRNVLSIRNIEPSGPLGNPPWFMVTEAQLIPR
jgi:hypothetical protein